MTSTEINATLIQKFNAGAVELVAKAKIPSLKTVVAEQRDNQVYILINGAVFGRGVDLPAAVVMARQTAKKFDDVALKALFGGK